MIRQESWQGAQDLWSPVEWTAYLKQVLQQKSWQAAQDLWSPVEWTAYLIPLKPKGQLVYASARVPTESTKPQCRTEATILISSQLLTVPPAHHDAATGHFQLHISLLPAILPNHAAATWQLDLHISLLCNQATMPSSKLPQTAPCIHMPATFPGSDRDNQGPHNATTGRHRSPNRYLKGRDCTNVWIRKRTMPDRYKHASQAPQPALSTAHCPTELTNLDAAAGHLQLHISPLRAQATMPH